MGRHWILAAKALAVLYPLSLLALTVALRAVGERWWVTAVALYLPRVVFAAPLPVIALALYRLRLGRWLWTQVPAALLLVFPLLGFVLPWPQTAGGASMRVLSYNVDSGKGGVDRVVAEVDRFTPDIVLLQEVGHADVFAAMLHERYATVDVYDQFILAARYPLSGMTHPERIPLAGEQRSPRFMRYVLDTPLGPVVVYNVHPISPRDDFTALRGKDGFRHELLSGRVFTGEAAPRIQGNSDLRALQVAAFAEGARRETAPVVIAGDTNLPGLSPVLAENLAPFTDGFTAGSWGLGYTYPNDRIPWMRIDRIVTTEKLRFTRFQVGASSASDHLCVVADLSR